MAQEPINENPKVAMLRRQIEDLQNEEKVLAGGRRFFSILGVIVMMVSPAGWFADVLLFVGILIVGIGLYGVAQYLGYLYIKEAREKRASAEKVLRSLTAAPAPEPTS
jgi:hypothetical protein